MTRRAPALSVACPKPGCNASPGHRCNSIRAYHKTKPHAVRVRAARAKEAKK